MTVIVTGLGRKQVAQALKMPSLEHVRPFDNQLDYEQLDEPTISRRQVATGTTTAEVVIQDQSQAVVAPIASSHVHHAKTISTTESMHDIDYLDIPAFLRRKNDNVERDKE